jgi:pyruvate,water dikinase
MLGFIRKLMAGLRTRKESFRAQQDEEALQRGFKLRYLQFKRILSANDKVLNMMAEMETALQGAQPFGMSFIRSRCALIAANVLQIIQHLNSLAPAGGYRELDNRFQEIQQKLAALLETPARTFDGPLVVDLHRIDKTRVDAVGVKMATLGEISQKLGIRTPPGFVITAAAYRLFMAHNRLPEELDRRLQVCEGGAPDQVHELRSALQQLVIQAPLPPALAEEIERAHAAMADAGGRRPPLAVRSSASNEDARGAAFAGQYRSLLNVSARHLHQAYKEVVASKYTETAMSYRLRRGLKDPDVVMCVGCLRMIPAVCGGVVYSLDPLNPAEETLLIDSVWGLPGLVVDGRSSTDRFVVSRAEPLRVLSKEITRKPFQYECLPEEGICRLQLDGARAGECSLTDEQALEIGRLALRLEAYFGEPQDIEWAIDAEGRLTILQCRPLQMLPSSGHDSTVTVAEADHPALLQGGVTVSPGAGVGPVSILKREVDKLQFPPGGVMVISQPLPGYAPLLSRAAAVIAEYGSLSCHLANVAREYGVPALFGMTGALVALPPGQVVTVDGASRRVFAGAVEGLARLRPPSPALMAGTPVYGTLHKVAAHILPLNLLDADAVDFRPAACRTFHDIIRFCHESAVREMFQFGRENEFPQRASKQLLVDVPTKWWVLNLDDGFREEVEGRQVRLDNIVSIPMLSLWEGITLAPWQGPPPIDGKGLISVMFEATRNPALLPGMQSRYAERNYFMIAKNYCSLTTRFGFHFASVESCVSERVPENYILFRFKGGAADDVRRHRRVNLIGQLLEEQGFQVTVADDLLRARFEDAPMAAMRHRLTILGYLIIHTRQLDMVMSNDALVAHYRTRLKRAIAGLSEPVPQEQP